MRLRLDDLGILLPARDEGVQPDGSVVITSPPLTLSLSPLALLAVPDEGLVALAAEAMRRDCPPGSRVRVLSDEPGESALGWPMRLVHVQVDSADGTLFEERLGAIYQFLRYTATAVGRVGGTSGIPFASLRPGLLQLLRSGRPDWRGHAPGIVAALWDIWQ